ncbi:MAG TPA: type II toxin-antitoxin system RelE/ParE family toxin [Solirubrobacteraceae bacterium]
MAAVRLSKAAVEDLDRMIVTHSLPVDTRARVQRSLRALERFPRIGGELEGRWSPFRLLLGPWRWMLVVYIYDEREDVVSIVSIQDARSSAAATSAS